jgi:NAD(P)-dependent dehydrogenase (short-subunit alcohol dehydrogenase family)
MLKGSSVVVLGGSSGIGAAVARRAVQQGANVTIVGRDLTKTRRIASSMSRETVSLAVEMTSEPAIIELFKSIGQFDHLVVTAAAVQLVPFKLGASEQARAVFEGKFWPQYLAVKHADVRASVSLFSGLWSHKAEVGGCALAAVNGAIEALGRALAIELAPTRVNVISPGLVGGTASFNGMPEQHREKLFMDTAKRLPARVIGSPEDIASATLCAMDNAYMTGSTIELNGGALLV